MTQKTRKSDWLARIKAVYKKNPLIFLIRAAVLFGVAGFFVFERAFWTPDTLLIIFFIVFVALGQARAFLLRFAPFLLLLLTYDSFRGIADNLNQHTHFLEMAQFDITVFGHLPTAILQSWWWHGTVQWYDFYFYFLYTIHFLTPVLLAIVIWKFRPKFYWQYVTALVGLSFAAFITYIVFPAAPPWMASDMHLIPQIHRVSSDVWYAMGVHNFSEVYAQLSPNPVAAVPSLHSAYPFLFTLFAWKLFGLRKTWWVFIYPLSMWIGVVYMGEHYVFDVIAGIIYATVAYFATMKLFELAARYKPTFKKDYARGYAYAHASVHKRR